MALTADVERQIGSGYEIEIFNMVMAPSVAIYAGAALTTPRKINTLQNFQA